MIEGELGLALSRPRYARHTRVPSGDAEGAVGANGHHHGHRSRSPLGSFGQVEIEVPRARLNSPDGKTTEWKSKALRAYQRRTLVADAPIAGAYLAGTNIRRVRRALASTSERSEAPDRAARALRRLQRESPTLPFVLVSERGSPFTAARVHLPGLRPALPALTAGPLAAREAFFACIISVNSI
jgi:putative transposase